LADTPSAGAALAERTDRADEVIAIVTSADGVRHVDPASTLYDVVAAERLCWIDIVGSASAAQTRMFCELLGLDPAEQAWMQRFGQAGRMFIDQHKVRAVTWLVVPGAGLVEIHVLCIGKTILSLWQGDPRTLDLIRGQFATRAGELERSPHRAAAILLQFLLATLYQGVGEVDDRLEKLARRGIVSPGSLNLEVLTRELDRLRSELLKFERYNTAVRLAVTGIEALPSMDPGGAAELNDYADQVEDLEARMQQRSRWASEILQRYTTVLAERQSKQLNRLTLVATIFLPITFLTGFFGMNFTWMINGLGSPAAFLLLGILLPAISVLLTVLWFKRRGLI
jgi:Mg2+ and Co2+ transporter CorA